MIKRILLLVAVYVVLMFFANWIHFQQIHHQYFIKKNNYLFSTFGNGGQVEFYEVPNNLLRRYLTYDVLIKLSSQQQRKRAIAKARKAGETRITYEPVQYDINTWAVYGNLYLFLMALVIALPLHWKKRLWALTAGFVLLELFFAFKVWLLLSLKFSIWYEKFEIGWNNNFLIDLLNYVLLIITYPFFGMLFITVIYALINYKQLEQYLLLKPKPFTKGV